MRTFFPRTLLLIAVSCLLIATATAADKSSKDHMSDKQMPDTMKKMSGEQGEQFKWARHVGDILDSTIVSPDGQELGKVEDLVIGKDGRIQYVILSNGGFIGIGKEKYAIPWGSIRIAENLNTLMAEVSEETIRKFTDSKRRSSSKSEEGNYVENTSASDKEEDKQAKAEKSGAADDENANRRMSEMKPEKIKDWFGKEVLSKNKEPLGTLVNAYIDEDGKITYMVVEPVNARELRPIPIRLIHPTDKKDKLVAEIDKKTFDEAPSFEKSNRPELSKAKWEEKVRGYYGDEKGQESEEESQ